MLPSFVQGFLDYGRTFNTTPLFLEMTAHWMLGTAVTRQVGLEARGQQLCPNMFIHLIAGPGSGKSQAINAGRSIFTKATDVEMIPASITRAGMEDYMADNIKQRVHPDGSIAVSNECVGMAEELQGILPENDLGHLTLYNLLYDLPRQHKARTRSNGEIKLLEPYCSILTGAQPAFLATTMPEQAWGMGFMSRSVMVFDVPNERKSMFEMAKLNHAMQAKLIGDLKQVHKLNGWFAIDPQAVKLYDHWWVMHGGAPVPQAKRLAMGYNSRRELHMMKLAMTHSLSRTNELYISLKDMQDAITLILKVEERMKSIFNEMAQTGSVVAIQDLLDMVRARCANGEVVPESDLIGLLMQRLPSTQVQAVLDNLVSGGMLEVVGGLAGRGLRKFKSGKKLHIG